MKLVHRQRREAPETIIAMIDVVFFLLVFFMLIGRMDATAPFEVDPPVAMTGADMPGGGATVSVSEAGEFALNGTAVSRVGLFDAVTRALLDDPELLIRINAHKGTRLRDVLPLAADIEALGARQIVLVVTPGGT